eukprot:Sspe_Gene.8033::Locus_2730_Transcript_1_1_Confidence_1.000_Length_1458::g.8033::m.8033
MAIHHRQQQQQHCDKQPPLHDLHLRSPPTSPPLLSTDTDELCMKIFADVLGEELLDSDFAPDGRDPPRTTSRLPAHDLLDEDSKDDPPPLVPLRDKRGESPSTFVFPEILKTFHPNPL